MSSQKVIWTIGHSNRTLEIFIELLRSFNIQLVADVRQFPGSRKYPYFNKEELQVSLPQHNINYVHLVNLGGRRKVNKDSPNITWKHPAFRSYADYMETDEFAKAAKQLEQLALQQTTAYMCSEAVWWSCHRSMISDYLKVNGWKVMHIMDANKACKLPHFSSHSKV